MDDEVSNVTVGSGLAPTAILCAAIFGFSKGNHLLMACGHVILETKITGQGLQEPIISIPFRRYSDGFGMRLGQIVNNLLCTLQLPENRDKLTVVDLPVFTEK